MKLNQRLVALSCGFLLCSALMYEWPSSARTTQVSLDKMTLGSRGFNQPEHNAVHRNGAAKQSDANDLQREFNQSFVNADNGRALIWNENSGIVQHFETSMPVFKAFGISFKRNALLYSPLKNRIPSGELFLENLEDKTRTKLTADLILEAAFSPDETKVAYTFATGMGFGLALVDIDSKQQKKLVSENVQPDFFEWDPSGNVIHYFKTTGELNTVGVAPYKVSIDNKRVAELKQEKLPENFPKFSSVSGHLEQASKEFSSTHSEIHYPFEISSPDKRKKVCGGNFFGSTYIQMCEKVGVSNHPHLTEGKLLKVINRGVIIRSIEEAMTTINFVDWNGNKERIAASSQVSYNLPLSTFTLSQGGSSYLSPGNCNISSHTGNLRYAYDMQNQTVGKHVLSAAEGLVIYVVENINCNSCDSSGCGSAACPSGGSNGGWGNAVIVQHADGTWTKYAHLQFNSVPVSFNGAACQGLYLGNQGHTGCSAGNFNGCGDHLHYQRQIGSDRDSASEPTTFSDVSSNPLACFSSYTSRSTEVISCSTCRNGTSTLRNRDGGPPIHPPGTVIKNALDQTVYLIDSENRKRPITSSGVLAQLYNQSTDARTGTNFTNWVITVGQDELDLYEQGGNLSAALPGNGKPFPDGKLIGYNGEVSIVTGGGGRRPFTSGERFTGLGYDFCQVVNLSQAEYNSYPAGPPVDAMPLLTSSLNISPSGPYTVGQNITGTFSIKNVGYESLPFSNLGIGGRFNGTTIYDMNFVSTTLAPGSSYNYGSQPRQLSSTGTYNFFAAYQESNGHWSLSVPASPGVIRNRQITVEQSNYTITVSASPSTGGTVNGGGTFPAGSSRTVNASPNSGHTFSNWTENGSVVSSSASYTFTLNGNRSLVANFSAVPVNHTISVSASPAGGGSVSGGGTFPAGSSRTVTATANGGYTFSNWTEGGTVVSSSASYTFTLNGNRSLVANFTGTVPNDNFADSQVTSGASGSVGGSNVGASKEEGEPSHAGNTGGASVWYRWQAPNSGSVTIHTAGSDFDTLLGVYTGSGLGSLATIASNDDNPSGGRQSIVTFDAVAGVVYHIAVDGYGNTAGNITLGWSQSAPSLVINSVAPPAGRTSGGQQIRLAGSFANLATVRVGGVSASWVYANAGDATAVNVTTPAHPVGAVAIELTSASGAVYTKANAFAYLPTSFTENELLAGVTTAKAQHIIELRQAVDALRAVAGLAPAPWTDPILLSVPVRAAHVQELRGYLEDTRVPLNLPTFSYTDPNLGAGSVLKRVHVEDLRQRIRSIAVPGPMRPSAGRL